MKQHHICEALPYNTWQNSSSLAYLSYPYVIQENIQYLSRKINQTLGLKNEIQASIS